MDAYEGRGFIGPHRILAVLGHGGMGVVYKAEHVGTGALVALKVVRGPTESTIASMRREIRALRRVRHPGVARILDDGLEGGLPWCAMELLAGANLRSVLQQMLAEARGEAGATSIVDGSSRDVATVATTDPAGSSLLVRTTPAAGVRVPIDPLAVIRRACAPLAFLHGRGLVHRDIKPENIFVRQDGAPVLVDFGLATPFGGAARREQVWPDEAVIGSIPYMAPEQIRGELVDARADLYALGCILYECLTGRAPFVGTAKQIQRQQVEAEPIPPSKLALPRARRDLDDLVMRLLAKRPKDRIGYADDVAEAIARATGEHDPPEPRLPKAEPYVYRSELAGRDAALSELHRALLRVRDGGRGGIALVSGESGVGKTRLVMELATTAIRREFEMTVIAAQCAALDVEGRASYASIAAAPLSALRPLLVAVGDRCRTSRGEATPHLLGARGKILAAYEPSLLDVPGVQRERDPRPLPPQAARERVLDALADTLAAFAAARPVLLIVDDLQWADDLTLAFLERLGGGALDRQRVLVVGTYRVEEARQALDRVDAMRLPLDRLDDRGVVAMVSGMLALRDPPEALVEFLRRSSAGNPLFVAEYLRAAIDAGLLERSAAGAWRLSPQATAGALSGSVPLPSEVAELIDRRLQGLDDRGRELVACGAVLGREIDGETLAEVAGLGEAAAMDEIAALSAKQILEEQAGGTLRFVHDKIREIAYERIDEERRRALHLRAAEVIGRSRAGADADAVLGHHLAKAGVHDRASVHLARAGDLARAAYANGQAISLYQRAIAEAERAGAPTFEIQESLGDVLAISGRQEEARRAFEQALGRRPEVARLARARLLRKTGKAFETLHEHDQALRAYALAEAALGDEPPEDHDAWWRAYLQIQNDRIWVHYWQAQVAELEACVEALRPLVDQRATPIERMQFFQSLMHMALRRDRFRVGAETVAHARASLEAAIASADAAEICGARFALGFTVLCHDDLDEAEAVLGAALQDAERIGDVPSQTRCLVYLAVVARRRGRVTEVRALAERTIAVATEVKMMDYLGAARASLGWVALRGGDHPAAEAHAAAALEIWRGLTVVYPFEWLARLPLLDVALQRGDAAAASAQAAALLDEKQQRLPDELAAPLRAGHLAEATETARRLAYL